MIDPQELDDAAEQAADDHASDAGKIVTTFADGTTKECEKGEWAYWDFYNGFKAGAEWAEALIKKDEAP